MSGFTDHKLKAKPNKLSLRVTKLAQLALKQAIN